MSLNLARQASLWAELRPLVWPWDPPAVGWRGPIADDADHWSFWSSPIRTSGQRPRVPRGQYLQVRVNLQTETLWDFARLDSLAIESLPLLAERVLGEIAVADDLHPPGNVAQVAAGVRSERPFIVNDDLFSQKQLYFFWYVSLESFEIYFSLNIF